MLDNLKIYFSSKQYQFPAKTPEILKEILKIVTKDDGYFVNLFLVGKRKSQQLNSQYRKINKPTDVLAFPFYYFYQAEITLVTIHRDLGDIFICYPVVVKQAKQKKCSVEWEICFLFLHGLLHCLGYDHEEVKEREIMFSWQDKVLMEISQKFPNFR